MQSDIAQALVIRKAHQELCDAHITILAAAVQQSSQLIAPHVHAEGFMTLVVTGDAGKTVTLEANLARFGIAQLARTGTVSLKRGQLLLEVSAQRRFHIHADVWSLHVHSIITGQHAAAALGIEQSEPAAGETADALAAMLWLCTG